MKKNLFCSFIFAAAMCLVAPSLSSCGDDTESTDAYFITASDGNANFTSNLYLQTLVGNTIGSAKVCTEKEAKNWLDSVYNAVVAPGYVDDIPLVTPTTFTLVLKRASSDPESEGTTIASKNVTLSRN
jgi:hypothetical protein